MGVRLEPGGVTLLDGGVHLHHHSNVGIGVHAGLLPSRIDVTCRRSCPQSFLHWPAKGVCSLSAPHLARVAGGQLEMDRLAGLGTTQAMGQRHQQAVQQRMLVGQQASCTPDFGALQASGRGLDGRAGRLARAVEGAMSTLGLLWMRRVFPAFSKVRR